MHLYAELNTGHTALCCSGCYLSYPNSTTDDGHTIMHFEPKCSTRSTLSTETIGPKNPQTDKLTYLEAIWCLKIETCRPTSEKKRIYKSDSDIREHEVGTGTDMTSGRRTLTRFTSLVPKPTPAPQHAELLCPVHQRRHAVSAMALRVADGARDGVIAQRRYWGCGPSA
ncbi:hypothetical protein EDB87DRAFT_1601049 [Lactarius vividus]|nr:hypothetical protein EDB87DRAFT_1601049 [Lactarius vividus]